MKIAIALLSLFCFVSAAHAAQLECVRPGDEAVQTFVIDNLQDCSDIKPNTVCDYDEGHDNFTAYAFEKGSLTNVQIGDSVAGFYLEGVVFTQWLVTSEEALTCKVK